MDVADGDGQGRPGTDKAGRERLWCGVRIALDVTSRYRALAPSCWYTRLVAGSVQISSQTGAEVAGCDECKEDAEEAVARMADLFTIFLAPKVASEPAH